MNVALVNMPFSAVEIPSLALTQLQAVLARDLGSRVSAEVHYPSHDVCRYLGLDLYRAVCDRSTDTGVGDWLFSREAFPELPDNAAEYFQRYFPGRDQDTAATRRLYLEKRAGLPALLDALIDRYRLREADVVGLTTMFAQTVPSLALARRLKEVHPGVLVVMGGANCEASMGRQIARHAPAVDYVFSGPALKSFPTFLERLLEGGRPEPGEIPGVFGKEEGDGAPLGQELSIDEELALDFEPFLDALSEAFPGGEVEPILLFETSRGCWWGQRAHCTFCGLNGSTMAFRAMPPDLALRQFESLFTYYPRVRHFDCVDNIMPVEYPETVFSAVRPPAGASIFYEVKADLTGEQLELLSEAGVSYVQPGIEALATSTLILMRKGTTAPRNIAFLKSCLTHDVHPAWNLLVGFPGETEEVYEKYLDDIPRLVHLTPPSGVFPVRFDRFSPYFVQADRYGLDLEPLDYYAQIYPFDRGTLHELAYYFADQNITAPYFQHMARWIGRLRKAQAEWAQRWSQGEASRPALHFTGPEPATTVYDSRFGEPVVHDVGEPGRRLLSALSGPTRRSALASRLDGAAVDVESEMARLRERGLVFEDGDRLVSLVLDREPPPRRRSLSRAKQPVQELERAEGAS